ncbi:general transcription factor 3C polypeptide 6 [Alosa sapidissima]|uniref:general transcription factor 3C polypeptide 6 n=1 Tax=Alosa sapidissima TaxID=34773 RepID=UPI001C098E23|nr:general transcription factor 3C polypeptide 6 [Alosa sapidissima]
MYSARQEMDEWEEEEQLVVAELSGIINSEFLTKCRGKCKIVDIDSDQPIMQVGRYVFAGNYEDALGTCVILEEQGDAGNPDLKYKCHTMKKLMMQRTFLTEKKEEEPVSVGIETLALSEGNPSDRFTSIICSFGKDHIAPDGADADALGASSDSDPEGMEREQSSMGDNPDNN